MPLYEYTCTACGHACEFLQKINDQPMVKCPQCGQDRLKRQVSATRFQLKGSGWYATDFKKPDSKQDKKEASETENIEKTTPPPKPSTETKE